MNTSPTHPQTTQDDQRGLRCPRCGCQHFRVVYTRHARGGKIMRNRECRHCGKRVITYERVAF